MFINRIKFIQFEKSQITISYLMQVEANLLICFYYQLVIRLSLSLSQTTPNVHWGQNWSQSKIRQIDSIFYRSKIFSSEFRRPGGLDSWDKVFETVEINILDRDLDKNWDFRVIETVETYFLKLSRISRHLRYTFWNCRDRDQVETNRDPQA